MSSSAWPCRRASLHRRRKVNSRHFRGQRSRYRVAPSTPLLRWNSDLRRRNDNATVKSTVAPPSAVKSAVSDVTLSTRAIAAGLWNLCFDEFSGADQTTPDQLIEEPSSKPRASNRKPERSKESDGDVFYVVTDRKILTSKRLAGATVVSELQAELAKARSRIRELEAKKHSLRKKVTILLSKLDDERLPRRNSEAVDELIAERRLRRRMEKANAKLIEQLAEVNRASERLTKDYNEEKKSRETLESLCDKLVQRISDDHSLAERTKTELEELAEERRMLQLAEVWREERVQMKLVDAKLALEERFSAMTALITELNDLLRHASCSLDIGDLQKAEEILQSAARALTDQDTVNELSYNVNETHLLASNRFTDYDSALEEDVDQSPEVNAESPSNVKHNVSPISRIRRSKVLGEAYRIASEDGEDRKVPRRRTCLENPHVARGMRGCIEWPRVIPKNVMKPKISEAIINSHKSQLRNILKPKA